MLRKNDNNMYVTFIHNRDDGPFVLMGVTTRQVPHQRENLGIFRKAVVYSVSSCKKQSVHD